MPSYSAPSRTTRCDNGATVLSETESDCQKARKSITRMSGRSGDARSDCGDVGSRCAAGDKWCRSETSRWLLEFCVVTLLMSYFVTSWFAFAIGYVLLRFLMTDFGRRCIKTIPRDLKGISLLIKIQLNLRRAFRLDQPVHHHFLRVVQANPTKICMIEVESGRSITFQQINEHANKYANLFKDQRYQRDDVIAIFLENGIDFFASWLGLSKLGVITAWINTNLKMETLAHSIRVSCCKSVITSSTLLPRIRDAASKNLLPRDLSIFIVDGVSNGEYTSLKDNLVNVSEPAPVKGLNFQSILCYIYTSGTTGNPKAAIIRHYRYYYIFTAARYAFEITESDRVYITLPMYHSAGGILGTGQIIASGATVVVRSKFSASNFWKDCVKYDCTVSQYIGEICRYLLAQKPCPEEQMHRVRIMYGNGLRPEIWRTFVERFHISRIGELYGSTEGNSNILNLDNHEGSCGFMPIYPLPPGVYPVRLIKVDEETGEIVRDPTTGLCIPCRPGDTGEMVGTIRKGDPMLRFEGYVSDGDTKQKVIRDVLQKGDEVFSSGDILFWDKLGYLYFKDRRGDTFRWKGENCATTEVEGVVQPLMSIVDATVYGVELPKREGRAGMISVVLAENADLNKFLDELAQRLTDNLAAYAIPVFLRICSQVDRTGTFKLKKAALQRDGYDPEKCGGDALYYWNAVERGYRLLSTEMKNDIDSGAYTKI